MSAPLAGIVSLAILLVLMGWGGEMNPTSFRFPSSALLLGCGSVVMVASLSCSSD